MRWPASAVAASSLAALLAVPSLASAPQSPGAVRILGDAIPDSLTGAPGDPVSGRAIVADRNRGLCLLCHAGPFPEQPFQGDLSPDLAGAGRRWSVGQLRLRIVDGRRLNPDTIMPPFYATDGLRRVGAAWAGRTILTAGEVEDVVAYLATLRD